MSTASIPKPDDVTDRDARSLLLFLECRVVDHGGRVDTRCMNHQDMELAKYWNDLGFVRFGRICSRHALESGSSWCSLSDGAWEAATSERALSGWSSRRWLTTGEFKEALAEGAP